MLSSTRNQEPTEQKGRNPQNRCLRSMWEADLPRDASKTEGRGAITYNTVTLTPPGPPIKLYGTV